MWTRARSAPMTPPTPARPIWGRRASKGRRMLRIGAARRPLASRGAASILLIARKAIRPVKPECGPGLSGLCASLEEPTEEERAPEEYLEVCAVTMQLPLQSEVVDVVGVQGVAKAVHGGHLTALTVDRGLIDQLVGVLPASSFDGKGEGGAQQRLCVPAGKALPAERADAHVEVAMEGDVSGFGMCKVTACQEKQVVVKLSRAERSAGGRNFESDAAGEVVAGLLLRRKEVVQGRVGVTEAVRAAAEMDIAVRRQTILQAAIAGGELEQQRRAQVAVAV